MWFDLGDDLSKSPLGPWSGKNSHLDNTYRYFHPLRCAQSNLDVHFKKLEGLSNSNHQAESAGQPEGRTRSLTTQSLINLPVAYGRSLTDLNIPVTPFSIISELLGFAAASNLQLLRQMEMRILKCVSRMDSLDDTSADAVSQQANLIFYRRQLEDQAARFSQVTSFIRHRHVLGWCGEANSELGYESRLELDIHYIAELTRELQNRCDREMTVLINAANIAEVQRGIDYGRTLFKLTLLAAIYVPASFVTSFFGMNIYELGAETSPHIWIYVIVTVILFTLSFAFLFLTRAIFRKIWRKAISYITI